MDTESIQLGEIWNEKIRENITHRNNFIVIFTRGALISPKVKDEILQAIREKKRIIPCLHVGVTFDEIEWDIDARHGLKFENKHELVRELFIKLPQLDGVDMTLRKDSVITSIKKWLKKKD